jgi:hypothetical protein
VKSCSGPPHTTTPSPPENTTPGGTLPSPRLAHSEGSTVGFRERSLPLFCTRGNPPVQLGCSPGHSNRLCAALWPSVGVGLTCGRIYPFKRHTTPHRPSLNTICPTTPPLLDVEPAPPLRTTPEPTPSDQPPCVLPDTHSVTTPAPIRSGHNRATTYPPRGMRRPFKDWRDVLRRHPRRGIRWCVVPCVYPPRGRK